MHNGVAPGGARTAPGQQVSINFGFAVTHPYEGAMMARQVGMGLRMGARRFAPSMGRWDPSVYTGDEP
jgi:hypothetical protein